MCSARTRGLRQRLRTTISTSERVVLPAVARSGAIERVATLVVVIEPSSRRVLVEARASARDAEPSRCYDRTSPTSERLRVPMPPIQNCTAVITRNNYELGRGSPPVSVRKAASRRRLGGTE
jgi:hypothetical protein